MRREHFYSIAIIALLLLNMGTLGYLWMDKKEGREAPHFAPPEGADRIIIHELQLDDAQQEEFEGFKHHHRQATDSIQRHIKQLQKELFTLVQADTMNMPVRDSLLHEIEKCESAKHLVTIEHFHEIRSILRPEQIELFNGLMGEIGARITAPGKRHHGPPPPGR